MAGAHKLDSLFAACPSGDGAHNSKKVFRLFLRRNIVFLCRAVNIKKKKRKYRRTNVHEKIHFCVRIFLPTLVVPLAPNWKTSSTIKFIILKSPQQFHGICREDVRLSATGKIIKFGYFCHNRVYHNVYKQNHTLYTPNNNMYTVYVSDHHTWQTYWYIFLFNFLITIIISDVYYSLLVGP